MAYKVTISDGTVLEKCVESVIFNVDTPTDNNYGMCTYTVSSMEITGRIGEGEKTIGLYEWALLPTSNSDCYKEIEVEQTHKAQVVRNVKFSKAFVVDYSESYAKDKGAGHFSIYIRQLAEVDIECKSEIIPNTPTAETKPANGTEESGLPQEPVGALPKEELPKTLKPGTLSNVEARKWYLEQEAKIPSMIDRRLPLEGQAKQAFNLRNQFRTQARELMADRDLAASLAKTDPNKTWEQMVQRQIEKGLTGDDIYKGIIDSSQKSRQSVNAALGLVKKRPRF